MVDELDRGVGNKWVNWIWAWLGCQDANEDSLQVSITDLRDYFFKAAFNFFYSLTIPSPNEEREVDLGTFVDEEEDDIDDESDVELDLDLDSSTMTTILSLIESTL